MSRWLFSCAQAVWAIARLEVHFFLHSPRMLLSALVVVLIPALYVVIYLTSVWDPAAKTGALPVAIVNLDQGLVYREQAFNVGRDVTQRLKAKPAFGYVDYTSEQKAQLGKGLAELQQGTLRLQKSIDGFREEADSSLFVATEVKTALGQFGQGVGTLDAGLKTVAAGQQKLGDGADALSAGVSTLTSGLISLNTGLRTIVTQLPEDRKLDELARGASSLSIGSITLKQGTQQVVPGAQHLAGGLDLLEQALPASTRQLDGNAQGLASSVQPEVEVAAPVQNNGSAFATNIVPGALWLGASLAAFLIRMRALPRQAKGYPVLARILGKVAMPMLLVLLQALLVWAALLWVLQMQAVSVGGLVLTLALAAATFLWLVFALTRALGDAGKALALIFLAVQLSSSGGILPVELSGGLFALMSPYLPITWVVKAIKASLFGAFDGQWLAALQWLALWGGLAALVATWVGCRRYVKLSALRPTLDL